MLTIPLDRLLALLDKASAVEIPVPASSEDETAGDETDAPLGEVLAGDPAYGEMMEAIGTLTPDEVYELLALGLLARNGAALDEWQAMVEQAQATPEESAVDELVQTLLLTDEIEIALERLGYALDGDEEGEEEEEEEDEGEEDEEENAGDEEEDEEAK